MAENAELDSDTHYANTLALWRDPEARAAMDRMWDQTPFGRIATNPFVLAGKPVLKGTRISVELIMHNLAAGRSDADIIDGYPHVTADDIEACIRFAATGARLSCASWADINMRDAILEDEQKEKRRLERMKNAGKLDWSANYTDRIVTDPHILGGKPTVKGLRISVEMIIDRLEGGESRAELIRNYPSITPEDIIACQQYASTGARLSNITEVELEITMAQWEAEEPSLAEAAIELMEKRGMKPIKSSATTSSQ